MVQLEDGQHYFQSNTQPFKDISGKVTSTLTISTDITHRKRGEEKNKVYAAGIENSSEGIVFTQMNGDMLYQKW